MTYRTPTPPAEDVRYPRESLYEPCPACNGEPYTPNERHRVTTANGVVIARCAAETEEIDENGDDDGGCGYTWRIEPKKPGAKAETKRARLGWLLGAGFTADAVVHLIQWWLS